MKKTFGIIEGNAHIQCENKICGVPLSIENQKQIEAEGKEIVVTPKVWDSNKKYTFNKEQPIIIIDQIIEDLEGKSLFDSQITNEDVIADKSIIIKKSAATSLNTYSFKDKTAQQILNSINTNYGGRAIVLIEENDNFKDGGVALKADSYNNPFEVNKAIEALITEKGINYKYSPDQIAFIRKYSGYGGLEKYGDFTKDELLRILSEFYTPDEIIKMMWALALDHRYKDYGDGSILEPSAGIGDFFKYAPKDAYIEAWEPQEYSSQIIKILYPNIQVYKNYFEQKFIINNESIKSKIEKLKKFSLVIGNPPYGTWAGEYASIEKGYSKARTFTEYFISRGIDLLVPGGLLIMVVGAEQFNGGTLFLDQDKTKEKEIIARKADLIDAYKLPIKVFERTNVSSEILVFRKKLQ